MRLISLAVTGSIVAVPVAASAEQQVRPMREPGTAAYGEFVAGPASIDDLVFGRQVLPPTGTPSPGQVGTIALAQSKTVFLNRKGVTLSPGENDSRTNRSTIVQSQTTIPSWNVSNETWTATVNCMKELFAPWEVTIVDTDPGNVPHIEAVFGGTPGQVGAQANTAGLSPFSSDCGIIENSVVFTFTGVIPQDARLACEIMAQEVAHSYGLDHEMLASDPMTYLPYTGNRSFKDQMAQCGESSPRPCGINGTTCRPMQNSVQLLNERLGKKGGTTTPPEIPPPATEQPAMGPTEVTGGCSTGGRSGGAGFGLLLVGLVRVVLRRRRC